MSQSTIVVAEATTEAPAEGEAPASGEAGHTTEGTAAEGGHGGRHGFVVAAFEGGHNFVIFLAGIEVFGLVVDPFAQRATHRVPPLNFSLGLCANTESGNGQSSQGFFVVHKFSLNGCVSQ